MAKSAKDLWQEGAISERDIKREIYVLLEQLPEEKLNMVKKLVKFLIAEQEDTGIPEPLEPEGKKLTWAEVEYDVPEERERFIGKITQRAALNIRNAVEDLKAKGIIDEEGHVLNKTLPPDMREDSRCGLE